MQNVIRYWKEKDTKTRHSALMSYTRKIEDAQKPRRTNNAKRLGLYWQKQIASMDGMEWARTYEPITADNRENVLRSIIDAATAKIATNKPRPVFVSIGGDYSLQKRAERLTLAVEGIFKTVGLYQIARSVFRDAAIWGTGLIKWRADAQANAVCAERVLVDDILVDHLDGKYGKPRNMIQAQNISRDMVSAMFPDRKVAENIAGASLERKAADVMSEIADPITLYEAWHLPSAPGSGDGIHCIYTTAGELLSEPWEIDHYPFAVFRLKPAPLGWHGIGFVEDLERLQDAQDWIDGRIKRMLNMATIRLYVPKAANVNPEEITNDTEFPFINFTGTQPPVFNPDPGPTPEVLNERERNKAAMFENSGISQLLAGSKKPAGLNSAVAQREYKDTESERFLDVGQAWDDFFCECARIACRCAQQLGGKYVVTASAGEGVGINRVKWSEVSMDENEYQIQVQAASILPREPAGRKEAIADLIGMFPQAAPLLAKQLQGGDIDAAMGLVSAPVDAILYDIEQLDGGVPITPEPFVDLAAARTMVLSAYLRARNKRAPQEVLEAYRTYLLAANAMYEQAQAAKMAQQAQNQLPPGMPPGA